jgi:nitrate reductase assembly molybdenum cofactor insertion protein NarJ
MNAAVEPWDRLAALVGYPAGEEYAADLSACAGALAEAATPLARFRDAVRGRGLPALQELYADAFDFDPACTLDLGWHLIGERPDRGVWLAALREDLARAGIPETGELPDHLAHLLRLVARDETADGTELAAFILPAVETIRDRLAARENPFVYLIEAVRSALDARCASAGGGRD